MFEGDFLKTYDPELIEVHTDSSDFDDSVTIEAPKGSGTKHTISSSETKISKKKKHILSNALSFASREIENRSDLFIYASNTIQTGEVIKAIKKKSTKTLVTKNYNEDNRKSLNKSKASLLKHKLLPCIPSIVERSYYKLYAVKETKFENTKDKICQVQMRKNRKGRSKFYARRNYIVQPVCTTHCRGFGNMKETQVSLFQRKPKAPVKQYSNTSVTVSLSSQHDEGSNKKEKDCKRILKDEIRREYKTYKSHKYRKHQEQQFPSKLGPYQVFTNPYQEQTTLRKTQSKNTSSSSNLPSRSSSFWNNLVDKFCKNKHNDRAGLLKPCVCQDPKPVCSPANCEFLKADKGNMSKDIQCSCTDISPAPPRNQSHHCLCEKNKTSDNSSKTAKATNASSKLDSSKTKIITKKNSKSKSGNIQCECFPKKSKMKTKARNKAIEGTHIIESASRPCQQPHDEITQALTAKYKGEIICIHNPPCVLINGCLNLPPPKENPIGVWSVAETRGSIYDVYTNLKSLKNGCDQGCQYDIPSVEVRQCQTSNLKAEKFVQSLCDHMPPCEIVRCCYRHKYDPKLKNSCIHVPMCQKVPECMIERTKQNLMTGSCEHKPRCAEVPICTRDYLILTAKDSVATQVRPQSKLVCRHQPHCVFIPKCLGNAIPESCVPMEAIPDCVHQPLCEMIPACCRKSAKEMISVCSQYPNGCRVV